MHAEDWGPRFEIQAPLAAIWTPRFRVPWNTHRLLLSKYLAPESELEVLYFLRCHVHLLSKKYSTYQHILTNMSLPPCHVRFFRKKCSTDLVVTKCTSGSSEDDTLEGPWRHTLQALEDGRVLRVRGGHLDVVLACSHTRIRIIHSFMAMKLRRTTKQRPALSSGRHACLSLRDTSNERHPLHSLRGTYLTLRCTYVTL